MELKVKEADQRLDKYLSSETTYSRDKIEKLIKDGQIFVNDKISKPSYKVKIDDVIKINLDTLEPMEIKAENIPLDILYEDEDIIVINKPSGLVVHPGSGNFSHTLVNALLYHTPNLSNLNGPERPGIVHRLDKDTSGLMLVCKSNRAHEILAKDFKTKKVHREYIALLEGVFPHQKAKITAPISRDKNNFAKYTVASDGKAAVTNLEVIKKYQHYTLVRLSLETGRTHQIRVHMAYIGYPVYNDPVYSKKSSTEFGQFLHSAYLEFKHPITQEKLTFEAPLPAEFSKFLEQIEKNEEENKIN